MAFGSLIKTKIDELKAKKNTPVPTPVNTPAPEATGITSETSPLLQARFDELKAAQNQPAQTPAPQNFRGTGGFQPATTFGKTYEDTVRKRLEGQDAVVQNARNQSQSQNAVRTYLANRQAREGAVQGGFTQGSAQYQRALDRGSAQADSSNLQSENQVNELQRGRSTEALGLGRGLEQEAQARNNDLINSIKDPKVQYELRAIAASGGDVNAAYSKMVENGTIRPEYASESPDQAEFNAFAAKAKRAHPEWNDEQIQQAFTKAFDTEFQPTETASQTRTVEQSVQVMNALAPGKLLDQKDFETLRTAGKVQQFAPNQVVNSANSDAILKENPQGIVSINGTQYRITDTHPPGSGQGESTDYFTMVGPEGTVYIDRAGNISKTPPASKGTAPVPSNSYRPSTGTTVAPTTRGR